MSTTGPGADPDGPAAGTTDTAPDTAAPTRTRATTSTSTPATTRVPSPASSGPGTDPMRAWLPPGMRGAASVSWRVLVIVAAVALVAVVVAELAAVVVPVAVAVLLAALLGPPVRALHRSGLPRALSTAVVMVVGLGGIAGIGYAVADAITDALPVLLATLTTGVGAFRGWLHTGPWRGAEGLFAPGVDEVLGLLGGDPAALTSGLAGTALGVASTLGALATGILLALFTLIFLLHDGAGVWLFVLRAVPEPARPVAHRAGLRAFSALAEHVYGSAIVAVVSALGVGVGLALLGVPLALPLAAVVLLGGFVPVVGPLAGGGVAVLVTLVALGPWRALAVAVLLLVLSLLAHRVLVPALLGRPAPLHPLATVLAVAVGVVLAGTAGALLAVPVLAVARGAADPFRRATRRRAVSRAAQDA